MVKIAEGLPIGQKWTSVGRTIGEGDFTLLTNLTWTTVRIHSDKEYMKSTQFGDRILAGVCVLAVAMGLVSRSTEFDTMLTRNNVRIVAVLGFESVQFKAPVFPWDTLTVETELLEARPTNKTNRGVMCFKDVARKQTGEVVMESVRSILFEKEPK
ncbi:MaoC/PaaZ C-terminal domain-containing protein [Chloroflexota bacterium]